MPSVWRVAGRAKHTSPQGVCRRSRLCYPSSPLPVLARAAIARAAPRFVAHSSRGQGRRPLTAVTRVQIPYALPPHFRRKCRGFASSRGFRRPLSATRLQPSCNRTERHGMVLDGSRWVVGGTRRATPAGTRNDCLPGLLSRRLVLEQDMLEVDEPKPPRSACPARRGRVMTRMRACRLSHAPALIPRRIEPAADHDVVRVLPEGSSVRSFDNCHAGSPAAAPPVDPIGARL